MALSKPFNHQPTSIASYDAIDIASGTGINDFYAGDTVDLKLLSNKTFYSDTLFLSGPIGSLGAYAKVIDTDFDVLINNPLEIEGSVVINVPIRYIGVEGGINTGCYVIAKVRKWDGTTETELVANTSRIYDNTDETGNTWFYTMLAIDVVIPNTTFKRGEYLRLTIEGWGKSQATNAFINIAHDPMGRSTDGILISANDWDTAKAPSTLIFQVPQKIDLP